MTTAVEQPAGPMPSSSPLGGQEAEALTLPREIPRGAAPSRTATEVLQGARPEMQSDTATSPPDDEARRLRVRESWEGVVLNVSDDTFTARLQGLKNTSNRLQATFRMTAVSPDDRRLVSSGAVFYLAVVLRVDRQVGTGQRADAELRFRRLPTWTGDHYAAAKRWGESTAQALLDAD